MSTFDDMVGFIKSANSARKFIVVCLEGPAGIGKTAACKQAARELAEEHKATGKVVTIIASQILPNEVSGITMPVVENKAMEIFDHYRLSSLEDGDMLFFDELLEADQLVLSACLTLIESRELMSGRRLPDVQIVAATNPTIKPNMLKENIRQRFVWRNFDLDREGCRRYIEKVCGFDVGYEVASKIVCAGDEYNILTPRSLTKMAEWMSLSENEQQAGEIAKQINTIWKSTLGDHLKEAFLDKFMNPRIQVQKAINHAIASAGVEMEDIDFESSTMTEVMEMLKSLPEWPQILEQLSQIEIKENDNQDSIVF